MFQKKKIFIILFVLISFFVCGTTDASAAGKKNVVLIDPAHGGKDEGITLTNDLSEKDITLAVALLMKKELLNEKNIDVVLTREKDEILDVEERKKVIEKVNPDFLITLHVNGGFGKNASGFEIYYQEYVDSVNGGQKKTKDGIQSIKNKAQNDSLVMAKIIQDNLNILFPRKGRGLRKAGLPVIEGLILPALAVEMSFATNADDRKRLLASKTQTDIAKALTKSIKTFYR